MAERKVLNKYFPPDFDPSLLKRRKMGKDRQQVVRLMAPFSMRCATCGEYIYKGKKFNARKETVDGEEYYGIKIFRFYIKCTQCSAEITFKTDPKNSDYLAEHGAARNFEPWRDTGAEDENDEDRLDRLEEEENAMEKLETKAMDSKREMDILDALQELKTRNSRIERKGKEMEQEGEARVLERVSTGVEIGDRDVGRKLDEFERKRLQEQQEDEEEIRRVFGRTHVLGVPDIELENASSSASEGDDDSPLTPKDDSPIASSSSAPTLASVKRKLDAVEPTAASLLSEKSRSIISKSVVPPPKKKGKANSALAAKLGIKIKK